MNSLLRQTDISKTQHIEVYRTEFGAVYQCDKGNCLYVEFGGKTANLCFPKLKRLKRICDNIDVDKLLLNAHSPDIEIIYLCACDDIFVLSALEIIALKDLLEGTFAMFELNHIIKDRLHRLVA